MAKSQTPEPNPATADLGAWHKLAEKDLASEPGHALERETPEGIKIKTLYTLADLERVPNVNSLPGLPPYLRGPRATMYTVRPWTIRQYAGFSTAEASNAFYRKN